MQKLTKDYIFICRGGGHRILVRGVQDVFRNKKIPNQDKKNRAADENFFDLKDSKRVKIND